VAFVMFLVFIGIYELMEFCDTTKRCGRWMSIKSKLKCFLRLQLD
jgi:hypothetical protein